MSREREREYFSITYYNITYIISEAKGGLPEKAKPIELATHC